MCSRFIFYETRCPILKLWCDTIYKIFYQVWRNMTTFLPNKDEWWHMRASENCAVGVKIVQCFRRFKRQILVLTSDQNQARGFIQLVYSKLIIFPIVLFLCHGTVKPVDMVFEKYLLRQKHTHMHIQAHAYIHTEKAVIKKYKCK